MAAQAVLRVVLLSIDFSALAKRLTDFVSSGTLNVNSVKLSNELAPSSEDGEDLICCGV